jgi:hypothetical protein
MKIKTNELTGTALDWAVAKCEGPNSIASCYFADDDTPLYLEEADEPTWQPSTNWAQGGPIIEREGICLYFNQEDADWEAYIVCEDKKFGGVERFECTGSTPLISAMRCYVASKLGEECDIPDELITGE